MAAGASVAAVAIIPKAIAAPIDDSTLLALEKQYFEQHESATSYHDEIFRLSDIWQAKSRQLWEKSLVGYCSLSDQQRWDLVTAMPECIEHNRLCRIQDTHFAKMEDLVKQMWAIPAQTPEGRRAKVLVALSLLPASWRHADQNTDYGVREARQLLIEFVGGEPGAQLREQFV
jgi:hypothetical protein